MPSKKTPASKRMNVQSIAKMAGVSPGTVSRVLNNSGLVHENTRSRVLEIARSVGFKPQAQVRTKQVAVITDTRFFTMRDGIYGQALAARVALALCRRSMSMITPEDPLEQLPDMFLDGIIVLGQCPDPYYSLFEKISKHTPIVFTDDFSGNKNRYTARSDHYESGKIAAKHLIQKGYKKLAFVGPQSRYFGPSSAPEHIRLDGYRETISKMGADCIPELFIQRNQEVSFYAAVNRAIRLGADALYVPGSSYESLEALNVINNILRLKVPEQVALIGGEIHGVSEFLTPPMTTIEEPLDKLSEAAVHLLSDLMEGHTPSSRQITFPVRLLSREST